LIGLLEVHLSRKFHFAVVIRIAIRFSVKAYDVLDPAILTIVLISVLAAILLRAFDFTLITKLSVDSSITGDRERFLLLVVALVFDRDHLLIAVEVDVEIRNFLFFEFHFLIAVAAALLLVLNFLALSVAAVTVAMSTATEVHVADIADGARGRFRKRVGGVVASATSNQCK